MGEFVTVEASDGFRFQAYEARPQGRPRGGVIVGQELFGVNAHIRHVTERFAAAGYHALAPQFYDRTDPGFAVGYSQAELEEARKVLPHLDLDNMVKDCAGALSRLSTAGKVGMVGFCSGGSTAWYCAARLDGLACAVSYYGGRIIQLADEQPRCPVMLHWGETDHTVKLEDVRRLETAHPSVESYVYPVAGHGFHCDMRAAFHAEAAALGAYRTLRLFDERIG